MPVRASPVVGLVGRLAFVLATAAVPPIAARVVARDGAVRERATDGRPDVFDLLAKRYANGPFISRAGWFEGKDAWPALPAWARRCPAAREALETEEGDGRAQPQDGGVVLERCTRGSGWRACYQCTTWALRGESCDGASLGASGSVADPFEYVSGLPQESARLASLVQALGWELARPDDPRHAGARASLTPAREAPDAE